MNSELQSLLRVQSLDLRIGELEKEIATLPKHIAEIEKALDIHNRRLEADRAALTANQKDRKRFEDDIKVQEQKISKLRDQMMTAKTNEQYKAFQHEIGYCEQQISSLETKILETMEESERLDKKVKEAEGVLKEERTKVEKEKAYARDRSAEDEKFLKEARDERTQKFSGLSSGVQQTYDRIRKRWKGVAVADATEGRCTACYIALRPQFFQDLKSSEKLMLCESCGRILYYKPPVDLAHEMHAPMSPVS